MVDPLLHTKQSSSVWAWSHLFHLATWGGHSFLVKNILMLRLPLSKVRRSAGTLSHTHRHPSQKLLILLSYSQMVCPSLCLPSCHQSNSFIVFDSFPSSRWLYRACLNYTFPGNRLESKENSARSGLRKRSPDDWSQGLLLRFVPRKVRLELFLGALWSLPLWLSKLCG